MTLELEKNNSMHGFQSLLSAGQVRIHLQDFATLNSTDTIILKMSFIAVKKAMRKVWQDSVIRLKNKRIAL
jgi:hypothetical protein